MAALPILLGAPESLDTELIEVLGGLAAAMASIGLLLLLPIYLTHRREVERLLEWKEREPEAGTTEFRAVPGPGMAPPRTGGKMTPAERVTSERPALSRISTGEYAAIEPEPMGFWQRVVDRGPRHPLVLAIAAILVGIAAFVVASQLIRSDDESGGKGKAIDPATVQVAVVSATSEPGVAGDVADALEAKGFVIASTSSASDPAKSSGVFYAKGERAAGKAVARVLKLSSPTIFGSEQEAAADGADVVVVAGEDGEAVPSKDKGGDGGSGGEDGSGGDQAGEG